MRVGGRPPLGILALAALGSLLIAPAGASASKEAVAFFGGVGDLGSEFADGGGDIAVNSTGAGPADAGDIYVLDPGNNRVERFATDNNGTPANPYDDTYPFISAWGGDVVAPEGGNDYEICTVAANCKAAVGSGGNGTAVGNGVLRGPEGIVVDQDTGDVYISDTGNFRINVYTGNGTFLRSLGWGVTASGPGAKVAPDEKQQLTIKAHGGKFSLVFNGKATGPRGVGKWKTSATVATKVLTSEGTFAVGQGISGSNIPPGTTIAALGAETLTLSQPTTGENLAQPDRLLGENFSHNASAAELEAALNALPSIDGVGGSVTVTGGPGNEAGSTPYTIVFGGSLGDEDVPLIEPSGGNLTIGGGTAAATVTTLAHGGAFEVCVAADGDVCKAGTPGTGVGQIGGSISGGNLFFGGGKGIAVSPPDGNPATGTVFLADRENRRVETYGLGGSSPSSFGSAANFAEISPEHVAVDSRGIVYATDRANSSEIDRYDSQNANGGGVGFLAPIPAPPLSTTHTQRRGLEVDLDSDGPGPDKDVLYTIRDGSNGVALQQFGPLNAPGLTAPPNVEDDHHGLGIGFTGVNGLGLYDSSGRLFVSTAANPKFGTGEGVYVLDQAGGSASGSLDSLSDITATTVTAHATIEPNGPPPVSYRLEYSTDGVTWASALPVPVGTQEAPQSIDALLDPPGGGLEPSTFYHVRLVIAKAFTAPITTPALTFTTLPDAPGVETVGAPVRTTTTAQIGGRVNSRGAATIYHFEYGDQGPCETNPCISTPERPAGSGKLIELVSEGIEGLEVGTTYHYRLVADNGNPGSPTYGEDMTVTTRASDAPLSHGPFPGPPGSDRAWEQVSVANSGGNPLTWASGFSEEGNRAVYGIAGGIPNAAFGSVFNKFFAERTPTGWQERSILPPRSEVSGSSWFEPFGSDDLSDLFALNTAGDTKELWHLTPGGAATRLVEATPDEYVGGSYAASDDGSTAVAKLNGSFDLAHPSPGTAGLFEISSGAPRLVSLMPGETVPACGVRGFPEEFGRRTSHWVSADGDLVFFQSEGDNCNKVLGLYLRDIEAEETKRITAAESRFLKSTPSAVFFWTAASLDPQDTGGGDVYRYGIAGESLECVTCLDGSPAAGIVASLGTIGAAQTEIAVAEDGSRVYFQSPNRLLPGTSPDGVYRVNVASGDLAYVADLGGAKVGDVTALGRALSPNGAVFVFRSAADTLNPLGGSDNAGMPQYYLYDDTDRSLTCVSCPPDGGSPRGDVPLTLTSPPSKEVGPNTDPLDDSGDFLFSAPTPLVVADQNTAPADEDAAAGTDVYEWRDGRLLLLTDGLTNWPAGSGGAPTVAGITPSGRDAFFTAAAQYTADALDSSIRLYDARVGGGIEFPPPPPPCPLEVCQGTPKGAPEEASPGTGAFSGPGNATGSPRPSKCRKGKVRRRGRCISKHKAKRRANRNRRVTR